MLQITRSIASRLSRLPLKGLMLKGHRAPAAREKV